MIIVFVGLIDKGFLGIVTDYRGFECNLSLLFRPFAT